MRKLLILVTVFIITNISVSQSYKVSSPGNVLEVTFTLEEGKPYYSLLRFGREIIQKSALGFEIKDRQPVNKNLKVDSQNQSSFDETWTQVWGEQKDIRNNYNELSVNLSETISPSVKMNIIFRVYDDGIGFRYEFPEQDNLGYFEITDELTEFYLTGDHSTWGIGAYQWNRYEFLDENKPLSGIDTVHTPFTMETEDGVYLSFHEAALYDYASMTLENIGGYKLKANLIPWSDGIKVKTTAPMKTPWRTIQVADTPGGLITSYLILNLTEHNKIEDISWIKPGKYVGIWWAMHIGISTWGSGPKHGATTENTKRYIDFASKYGFDGVLVEGWNTGWDGDWVQNGDKFNFTEPYPDFNLKEVAQYALDKGTRLIGHHETGGGVENYERQMKDAFALYESLGVRAVKTGYVGHGQTIKRTDENGNIQNEWHHGQYMVRHYQKVVELAAEHHIMIDAHEPIKDTGIRRTWPNFMTREGARGQEYEAWGGEGGNPPGHTVTIPFTRLLSGPMDFTPGTFDILFEDDPPVDNRANTTIAKQLAYFVVLYSPLQMASDLPENYEAKPDLFKFILDVPADWAATKVLNASIGNYITVVRKDRNSDNWYLGSMTDEEGRLLEVPLSFLDPGKKYTAEIYRDGLKADWITNPLDYEIIEQTVDISTVLELRLAAGGGQAIRFTPVK
ncbi:MAG: glycoside hydrolase family 97 protein [Ignavibacteriaceae bacterium]